MFSTLIFRRLAPKLHGRKFLEALRRRNSTVNMSGDPNTMRSAVVEKFNQPYTFRDIPRPAEPTGHDLLVKVLAASYCHTDAVFASGGMSQDLPRVGCHEFVGEVLAAGSAVESSLGVRIGARVGVPGRAYRPCGECW